MGNMNRFRLMFFMVLSFCLFVVSACGALFMPLYCCLQGHPFMGMGVILFCMVLVSLFISTGFCCAQQLEQLDKGRGWYEQILGYILHCIFCHFGDLYIVGPNFCSYISLHTSWMELSSIGNFRLWIVFFTVTSFIRIFFR